MIRLLLFFIFVAAGNAQMEPNEYDCRSSRCGNSFNASSVGTQFDTVFFFESRGFGPQNIVGAFHNGVKLLDFYGNDLHSFNGISLKNSNIKTL